MEYQDNWEANYPKMSSEILPGVESAGVVVLQPLDPIDSNAKILMEARNENWQLDFKPYVFELAW